jgi:serine O-acetyltransferase
MPIQSRNQLREWMRQDLQQYIEQGAFHDPVGRWRIWHRLQYPLIAWQRLMRRTEFTFNTKRGRLWQPYVLFRKVVFSRASMRLSLEIPLNVFGPGLTVAHSASIVVNANATVGKNCRLHPGTCIGELHDLNPTIGDDVYLGNGAMVIGPITVGDRAKIGPHALVRESVAPDALVVGTAGRKVG